MGVVRATVRRALKSLRPPDERRRQQQLLLQMPDDGSGDVWASSGTGRGCSHEYGPDCG